MFNVRAGLVPVDLLSLSTGYYLSSNTDSNSYSSHPPMLPLWRWEFYKPKIRLLDVPNKYGMLLHIPTIVSIQILYTPHIEVKLAKTSQVMYAQKTQLNYVSSVAINHTPITTTHGSPKFRIKKDK